jgi:hypothetical protein
MQCGPLGNRQEAVYSTHCLIADQRGLVPGRQQGGVRLILTICVFLTCNLHTVSRGFNDFLRIQLCRDA